MKRFFLLLGVYLLLLAAACGQHEAKPSDLPQSLSPEEQLRLDIGQMLLVGFRGTAIDESHTIVRDLQQYHVGSVILFEYDAPSGTRHRNIASSTQLQTLCNDLQRYGDGDLLIGVDQEGGKVARLRTQDGFAPTLSAQASAQQGDNSVSRNAAAIAEELHKAGINLNFAPCVDVNVNPNCPVIGRLGRSFSANADSVAHYAALYIAEHRQRGILTCLKHFPGHGSATGDTHAGLVDVTETWQQKELTPYRKLMANGEVDMVMVAHVVNRSLGDTLPASLSPKVVKGLLRDKMGYKGVIATDDMGMGAIARQYGFEQALRMAIQAGCDLLCLCNNSTVYNPNLVPQAVEAIVRMVENGEVSADDIHASAERVRKLKGRLQSR